MLLRGSLQEAGNLPDIAVWQAKSILSIPTDIAENPDAIRLRWPVATPLIGGQHAVTDRGAIPITH